MKITSSEFIISAVAPEQYPQEGYSEIVLIGKSNVGKSSLINKIINRKGLAKTSSAPGKTRTINFYKINKSFYMVDLPGYGYAKVSLAEKKSWKDIIDTYINSSKNIKCFIMLLDIRRDVGERELDIYDWLENFDTPVITVLTKCDKFSANKIKSHEAKIKKDIGIDDVINFSTESGLGKEELTKLIADII